MTSAAAPPLVPAAVPDLPRSVLRPRTAGVLEIAVVLGVSLGQSAVYSILAIIDRLTRVQPLSQQTSSLNSSVTPDRPWLDLSYQLVNVIFPLVPVLLALYLLTRLDPPVARVTGPRWIGFDLRRPAPDLLAGALTALGVGLPGLGLYLGARALGLDTAVHASGLGSHWWTVPVLIMAAAQNGVLEEVIMLGFLYTRLRQQGLRWSVIMVSSALIRGCYHLYQGFGGFVGNAIMGMIFGALFLRLRRVMPLVVAHTLLDVVAFVGYALIAPHVSWL